MAVLSLNSGKLEHNYRHLEKIFSINNIEWGVVTKLLCGNKLFLNELLKLGVRQMHDTRIGNIKTIKSLNPEIQTVYIKPPAKRSIHNVIKYADVSFNTEYSTIKLLSDEACRQQKFHKIIIMIEMGDLREGVMGDQLAEFYKKVFLLPNIEIIGIGTNFNCLNGILPNQEKLIQLCLYKKLIEVIFHRKIPWISGGTSVTLPLLLDKKIPKDVNHFRIGEALFFGNNLFTGNPFTGMETDVFKFYPEIIELNIKPVLPSGDQIENVAGRIPEFNPEDEGKTSYRAILDVGLLDLNPDYLIPEDDSVRIIEASSDMLVVDLGKNEKGYKTGHMISFDLKYMGVLGLMNSNYIEKIVN
ncbi:MAG: alanine racemase [Ignavibacteriae bacterium]|nr:alanine racemase [Ignavibacteriota bacterium]